MKKQWIKKVDNENRTGYYFDNLIKIEDFDFDDILWDENSYTIFWFMRFCTKLWLVSSHCLLFTIRWMGLLGTIMERSI